VTVAVACHTPSVSSVHGVGKKRVWWAEDYLLGPP
jgi:hypothetical protein